MTTPRFNPFPPVSGKYGAPMGRCDTYPGLFPRDLDLCVSHPQSEYDSGGAYWGAPQWVCGADNNNNGPVWAVWPRGKGKELGVKYVRAWNRQDAAEKCREKEI